ncbi:hypothetical protein ASPZODRAFT_136707 [Penicilliopsis zonata CBS 506.65]|uniref:Uncharacterized protein n=1 Tax=Penicilliopsis zonata CBS 506.65 TaxID=1073090 RepID=A0A1L9S7K9_9EURO|nr:hypothetical protein ASPZODRAFT_136707 [Penicilliopsis zonata CBS 506.65]OJJ43150.1 hypothetical protein ASPZODRAFT_136707 [Penicilliopsis zonata CBS 506.65]
MILDTVVRLRIIRAQRSKPALADHNNASSNKATPERRLLKLEELPNWIDTNPFILSGYRPESRSWWKCVASWAYFHNESANIWSHLIPAALLLLGQSIIYRHVRAKYGDRLSSFDWSIVSLQLLMGFACLLISALYHTLLNHSEHVSHRWLQMDYLGIIVLILGNFISGLHFGFYCHPFLKYFYWSIITILGLVTATILLHPRFRGPEWRMFRLWSFISTGLSAFAPIGHALLLWGPGHVWGIGVPYYLLEGVFLLVGCYFWERRVPECLFPGRFDLWGQSHTIWHVLVAFSVGAHVLGLLSAADYTYSGVCDSTGTQGLIHF